MLFGREYLKKADHELSDKEIRELYGCLNDEFVEAIKVDIGYAVDIMQHARMTEYKQELWKVRVQVIKDEQEARRRCNIDHRNDGQFLCRNESPCGFGHCPYAKPDNAFPTVPLLSTAGKQEIKRPRERSSHPTYFIEEAIEALLVMNGVRERRIR